MADTIQQFATMSVHNPDEIEVLTIDDDNGAFAQVQFSTNDLSVRVYMDNVSDLQDLMKACAAVIEQHKQGKEHRVMLPLAPSTMEKA